ncbi:MAG: ABC transporter ATP-binding protein [Gemmatimonadaceae bacterium]
MTTPHSEVLLAARGIDKQYGPRKILHDVNLNITRRSVTAIVGPNGAGKSTLNRILLGLVRADRGSLEFDGLDVGNDVSYRARIGYMPQAARFPENLTVRDVFALLDELRASSVAVDTSLAVDFDLDQQLHRLVRELSGGQRQRLNAALAFRYRPDLLLLDEPTAGLDPIASRILKRAIANARDNGRAVIVTSHVLAELEEIADRVMFLLEGRVQYSGTMTALLANTASFTLEEAVAKVMTNVGANPFGESVSENLAEVAV